MTAAERALLVALAKVVCDGMGRIRLTEMIREVEREDARRPYHARMPVEPPIPTYADPEVPRG